MIKSLLEKTMTLAALPAGLFAAINIPGIGSFGFTQGSGNVVERDIPVSHFNRVRLSGVGNLHISQGDEEALHVQGEDNILDILRVEVNDDELIIGFNHQGPIHPTKPLHFYVKAKEMEGITISGAGSADTGNLHGKYLKLSISGSGDIETHDLEVEEMEVKISGSGDLEIDHLSCKELTIQISGRGNVKTESTHAETLSMKISGAGDVKLKDVQANSLESKISGHGNIELSGNAETQQITISGSGNVEAFELVSSKAEVNISGVGNAHLYAAEELVGRVSGTGTVRYRGQPRMDLKTSGLGKISQDPG